MAKVVKKKEREETVQLMNISLAAEGSRASKAALQRSSTASAVLCGASAVFPRDSCGEKLFGLRVVEVTGIIRLPEIVKLPGGAEYILGVISFRGTVLTVIDLGRFLEEEGHLPGRLSQAPLPYGTASGAALQRSSTASAVLCGASAVLCGASSPPKAAVDSKPCEPSGLLQDRQLTGQVVIVSNGEMVFGILVDRVSEIKEIPLAKIRLAEGEYTSGTYKLNGQQIRILDIEKMVRRVR